MVGISFLNLTHITLQDPFDCIQAKQIRKIDKI